MVLVIAVAVLGEWFIEVAKDKGLYSDAGDRWDGAIGIATPVLTSGWVLFPTTALFGLVLGLWVDVWARRWDSKRNEGDSAFYVSLSSTHRGFRAVEEHLKQGNLLATVPQLNELVARFDSQQVGLDKRGICAPWLNYSTDPVGYFYRTTDYLNRIVPMLADGNIAEAKSMARRQVSKIQIEHPGPNGRKALQ